MQHEQTSAPVGRPGLILAVLCLGSLSSSLMQTLVIPIQGDLPHLLDTSRSNASWVVTVTLLAGAVVMPVAGRLSDILGRQRILAASAVLLALGSALCAVADSLVPMLLGRTLQGLAMGYVPVAINMVRSVVPPARVPVSIAMLSATMGVGGSIGMPMAAWIAQEHDWHALFVISGIIALLVLASTLLAIPHLPPGDPTRFDAVGTLGLAVGLGTLLIGISKGNDWGWGAVSTLGFIAVGIVVLLAWGRHQLRTKDPLVDLRVSARTPVLLTNVAAMLTGFGMMASSIVIPQLLILPTATGHGLGQTLLEAGLWLTPGGLVMLTLAPVSGRLIGWLGARTTLALGNLVLGLGYVISLVAMDSPWKLMLAMCTGCAGVALAFAAMPTLILANVPLRESGSAVGLNGLMRAVGTTAAGAVMAALLLSRTVPLGPYEVPSAAAFQLCFAVGIGATMLGAVISMLIPDRNRGVALSPA